MPEIDQKAVANETTKLIANALDRGSTASFAAGVLAPAIGLSQGSVVPTAGMAYSFVGWILLGIVLHYEARRYIGGMIQ
jgi:hypothetical protein